MSIIGDIHEEGVEALWAVYDAKRHTVVTVLPLEKEQG